MVEGSWQKPCEGCGMALTGRQRRFCGDRCRSRVRRAIDANAVGSAAKGSSPAAAEPGRCRAGLEAWLVDQFDVPEAVTEAARALADRVDADPRNSPLWGRYSTVLGMLTNITLEREDRAAREVMWDLFASCTNPSHPRVTHCSACCQEGTRACGRGDHEWSAYLDPTHGRICERCKATSADLQANDKENQI
jgi:hypothetical protein